VNVREYEVVAQHRQAEEEGMKVEGVKRCDFACALHNSEQQEPDTTARQLASGTLPESTTVFKDFAYISPPQKLHIPTADYSLPTKTTSEHRMKGERKSSKVAQLAKKHDRGRMKRFLRSCAEIEVGKNVFAWAVADDGDGEDSGESSEGSESSESSESSDDGGDVELGLMFM
jgi:hypothetical protein